MEYYSAIKKNEIRSFAATWTSRLSYQVEQVRKRKNKYQMISFIHGL